MILSAAALTTIGLPQVQTRAFNDEHGALIVSQNPIPAFEAASRPWFVHGE